MVHLTTALDAASGVPLYEQLYRSLAAEMRTGAISAGTRMPGKRRLAAELSVSVNTVAHGPEIHRCKPVAMWVVCLICGHCALPGTTSTRA